MKPIIFEQANVDAFYETSKDQEITRGGGGLTKEGARLGHSLFSTPSETSNVIVYIPKDEKGRTIIDETFTFSLARAGSFPQKYRYYTGVQAPEIFKENGYSGELDLESYARECFDLQKIQREQVMISKGYAPTQQVSKEVFREIMAQVPDRAVQTPSKKDIEAGNKRVLFPVVVIATNAGGMPIIENGVPVHEIHWYAQNSAKLKLEFDVTDLREVGGNFYKFKYVVSGGTDEKSKKMEAGKSLRIAKMECASLFPSLTTAEQQANLCAYFNNEAVKAGYTLAGCMTCVTEFELRTDADIIQEVENGMRETRAQLLALNSSPQTVNTALSTDDTSLDVADIALDLDLDLDLPF